MTRCTAQGLWGPCKYEEGHTGPHCTEVVTVTVGQTTVQVSLPDGMQAQDLAQALGALLAAFGDEP
ncbi:MAG: hypothetical protein ACRCSL_16785 [Microbacterium sp.]